MKFMLAVTWLLLVPAVWADAQTPPLVAGCPRDSQEFYPCAKVKAQAFKPPRTPDGKPDMQGAWNASTTTGSQNIEETAGDGGFFFRATKTLIVDPADGKIPYQPWALAQRAKHFEHYVDPYATCYPSGIPRQMYSPRGHHFLQSPGLFAVISEWAHVSRVIPIDGSPHIGKGVQLYMGDSRGRWEGDTLVVDTTNLTDETWFDVVGDFHSDAMHVTERLTMMDPDTIFYEATMDDPKVFTRPWTMAFPIMRMEKGHEVMEEACYEGDRSLPTFLATGYKVYTGMNEAK
jgi:hypothetical protein